MAPTPIAPSPDIARSIAQFLIASGYTEETLKQFGLTKTPWRESQVRSLLPHKLDEGSVLGVLIRLFFFGEAVPATAVSAAFSPQVTAMMVLSRMLRQQADEFIPECMLVHFDQLLLACDSVRRAHDGNLENLVLGVNRPTQILSACILPIPNAATLDLGTGCGALALHAAAGSARLLGTDINPRALEFARFNAALNGISNFESRAGDRFDPVKGERFDLIVSNPPFFLTPHPQLLFTGNPFTLDSFVESLARQAPAFLNEGGYFQMLCEWVELKQQPWRDRLKAWFHNSGCDVLILQDYQVDPADYVLLRAEESASLHGPATSETLLDHMRYFDRQGVCTIHGGLIVMRRSTQWPDGPPKLQNWFVADQTGGKPTTPVGDLLLDRFANEDILASESHSRILAAKPKLSRDVLLVQEAFQQNSDWKIRISYLERRTDLPRRLGLDPEIAGLVGQWDGSQDLNFHAAAFARKKNLPETQVSADFVRLARKLASLGLISLKKD